MAWQLRVTADTQAEYDAVAAWFDHAAACEVCGASVILSLVKQAADKVVDATYTTEALDWTISSHGG